MSLTLAKCLGEGTSHEKSRGEILCFFIAGRFLSKRSEFSRAEINDKKCHFLY
jgi:hypothetical protein